jgi:hypothetical protein
MKNQKKPRAGTEETFMNTAAIAVGNTLGKLAAKVGLTDPPEKPVAPARKSPKKKKAAKPVAKTAAKKKVAPKKSTR